MAYFEQTGPAAYLATASTGGAWRTDEQHVAPALGLLLREVERDRDARRDDGLLVARLGYDIWGTMPLAEVTTSVRVVRPGRTVELVEAAVQHGGRTAVTLRAWLVRPGATAHLAGTRLPDVPAPDEVPGWDPTTVWPGGFVASVEVRRRQLEPGRAVVWVRTDEALVAGQDCGRLAPAAGLLDIVNGMTVRADPREVAFPNLDLTCHVLRQPRGDWLGFDATVSFGPTGLGVTSSVLHDQDGPFGTLAQVLTVRP